VVSGVALIITASIVSRASSACQAVVALAGWVVAATSASLSGRISAM
jgi:hypothetical protein